MVRISASTRWAPGLISSTHRNQTDFVKVSKFDGYWQPGLPKLDSITRRPVVDNNTRAAMLQTGEAQFAFPIPYEQAPLLAKNSKLELVASPSIMQRYISMNVTQKPFDNPKVREAINYAINRRGAGEGSVRRLRHPGDRSGAAVDRLCPDLHRPGHTIRRKRASC